MSGDDRAPIAVSSTIAIAVARLFLIVLLLAAVPARAASPADTRPDSTGPPPASLVRALNRIEPASTLRVETTSRMLLEGTVGRWDVHSLLLRERTGVREIPLSTVKGLFVQGRATSHGANVGVITLGILGAVVGAATVALGRGIAEGGGPDGLRGSYPGMAVVGALAGGAAGALIGAGIGTAIPKWHRRFP